VQSIFWLILATLLMFLSMGWFALSLSAHQKQVNQSAIGHSQKPKSAHFKWVGWIALLLSGICCLQADHPSMAVLVWLMLIACSAFSIAMILSFRPWWLRPLMSVFCMFENPANSDSNKG